jgi:hypothetical protein
MSKSTMRNFFIETVVGEFLSIAAFNTTASAASLFYFKGPTKAPNERVCLSFARDQAGRHNLQNIKQDNLGVGGTRDNFFVVMTCVGKVVIVMVSGDTGTNGSPLAKELFDAVRSDVLSLKRTFNV